MIITLRYLSSYKCINKDLDPWERGKTLEDSLAMMGAVNKPGHIPEAMPPLLSYYKFYYREDFAGSVYVKYLGVSSWVFDMHGLYLNKYKSAARIFFDLALFMGLLEGKRIATQTEDNPKYDSVRNFLFHSGMKGQTADGMRIFYVPDNWTPRNVDQVIVSYTPD